MSFTCMHECLCVCDCVCGDDVCVGHIHACISVGIIALQTHTCMHTGVIKIRSLLSRFNAFDPFYFSSFFFCIFFFLSLS
jgi:hypothetical protein